MDRPPEPAPSVGSRIEDRCRVCRTVTRHTVMALGADGSVARVICDSCRSQHNFRGGDMKTGAASASGKTSERSSRLSRDDAPLPPVTERERSVAAMIDAPPTRSSEDLELLLRRVIREESGLTPVAPATRWRGGQLVLRPGDEGLQERAWPIETFFHKIVMIRNRLRTLEQQINASELPEDAKVKLQGYITACYGSLTSFNVLFADDADRFRGAGEKG